MSSSPYRVSITAEESQRRRLPQPWVRDVVRLVLSKEGVAQGGRVEVLLAGDETMRRLNADFRSEDSITDVLSFPGAGGDDDFPDDSNALDVGQIVLSLPQTERQAREAGLTLRDEAAHLLVHGVLHLLGYDHARPEEEITMQAREDALLLTLIGRAPHAGEARVHADAGSTS